MVVIRLARGGAKKRPFYNIVATDSRNRRDGRFIEKLGYYDPTREPSVMEVNTERLSYWYGRGANVSEAVATILRQKKIVLERAKTHKQA